MVNYQLLIIYQFYDIYPRKATSPFLRR